MKTDNKQIRFYSVFLIGILIFSLPLWTGGCFNDSSSSVTAPLSENNINLIFVVSADLAYNEPGDINPDTANLTNQGLQRSLMMATYLKEDVLGGENVTAIHALAPMTHLQTDNHYPDMTGIGSIQPFALLNQITLPLYGTDSSYTAYSYPIHAAYGPGSLPDGVVAPEDFCPDCQGLAFNDTADDNLDLAIGIITANVPGFYVFSAPWETVNALMASINQEKGYTLDIPTTYMGPNRVYAISVNPSEVASLATYDSHLDPPSTYPELPLPVERIPCSYDPLSNFSTSRTGGVNGVVVPAAINTNEKIYIVRHAEAHPDPKNLFEDGNFVGAGQWRALDLVNALDGKISPDMVYSIDPAQWLYTGHLNVSYVRPSLTILPYVIANNLPYRLVSHFYIGDKNHDQLASDFFFTGGTFSNQTILLAWESSRIKPLINALLKSYGGTESSYLPIKWPSTDYDTVWTVTIDDMGNVTVDNDLCEGIYSASLPVMSPEF